MKDLYEFSFSDAIQQTTAPSCACCWHRSIDWSCNVLPLLQVVAHDWEKAAPLWRLVTAHNIRFTLSDPGEKKYRHLVHDYLVFWHYLVISQYMCYVALLLRVIYHIGYTSSRQCNSWMCYVILYQQNIISHIATRFRLLILVGRNTCRIDK